MSFAPTKGGRRPSGASQKVIKSATFSSRPSSASSSVHRRRGGTNDRQGVMSVEDFTKQVKSQLTFALSPEEIQAIQAKFGTQNGGIDYNKFMQNLGKAGGLDKSIGVFNFLPKHTSSEGKQAAVVDVERLERSIRQKIEDRCEVAGNYQYQSAYRLLCDASNRVTGGMDYSEFKLRLSELLGVEMTAQETEALFGKYCGSNGKVDIRTMVQALLGPKEAEGWFFLNNQLKEHVETARISTSARFRHKEGDTHLDPAPANTEFPDCLKGFKWDLDKFEAKLKSKINEHAHGHAGYLFLAACKLFRHELPHRKGDEISTREFEEILRTKFALNVDERECKELFDRLEPNNNGVMEIRELVRALLPHDYKESWFTARESTDMYGYKKSKPDEVVLQAKEVPRGHWNVDVLEDCIKEKIHERCGGSGGFEVQEAHRLFSDGRISGMTKEKFRADMHDKFAIVFTKEEIDAIYERHDPEGTGVINLHQFVLDLVGRAAPPEPWFQGRDTYEFRVKNRAPMKKAPQWKSAGWDLRKWEEELRAKIEAKSKQDGGRYAYKSAINLLRSANPDHLDSSNLTREGAKFVLFRRFDIVMQEDLLDEVFAKYADEKTGKIPLHKLVRAMLPPGWDGSHHLVPKSDGKGTATRNMMGEIFAITGKRREIMALNGAGLDHAPGMEETPMEQLASRTRMDSSEKQSMIKAACERAGAGGSPTATRNLEVEAPPEGLREDIDLVGDSERRNEAVAEVLQLIKDKEESLRAREEAMAVREHQMALKQQGQQHQVSDQQQQAQGSQQGGSCQDAKGQGGGQQLGPLDDEPPQEQGVPGSKGRQVYQGRSQGQSQSQGSHAAQTPRRPGSSCSSRGSKGSGRQGRRLASARARAPPRKAEDMTAQEQEQQERMFAAKVKVKLRQKALQLERESALAERRRSRGQSPIPEYAPVSSVQFQSRYNNMDRVMMTNTRARDAVPSRYSRFGSSGVPFMG